MGDNFWVFKASDYAIVFATLMGPVLAVQAQKWLERRREARSRREWIFKTLMATRANVLAVENVQAINMVPIEFYGKARALTDVREAWKAYLHHLGVKTMSGELWEKTRLDLYSQMLKKIGAHLGYKFSELELHNEVYFPTAHGSLNSDQELIRRGFADVFSGKRSLPIEVNGWLPGSEPKPEFVEVRDLFIKWLRKVSAD